MCLTHVKVLGVSDDVKVLGVSDRREVVWCVLQT